MRRLVGQKAANLLALVAVVVGLGLFLSRVFFAAHAERRMSDHQRATLVAELARASHDFSLPPVSHDGGKSWQAVVREIEICTAAGTTNEPDGMTYGHRLAGAFVDAG